MASGGVGAAMIGVGLAALALAGGWAAGAVFGGDAAIDPPTVCGEACSSAVLAEAREPEPTRASATATPESDEPEDLPYVSARSVAVIESSCGALMFGRDEHAEAPPASLTKLMTAAVATDQAPVDSLITSQVDGQALYDETGSTIMGLRPGMQLSLLDLLYGLLLPSGNDAAIAIAEGISGDEANFVALMNAKAASLALGDTHFTNPHGLYEPGLRSSAKDMAMLARYVMQNPNLREIVRSVSWQPNWDGPPVWNGNRFLGEYDGADGVKIGYTEESRQTIVASATHDGRRIIATVLQSDDRYQDAQRLLDWAFEQDSACP